MPHKPEPRSNTAKVAARTDKRSRTRGNPQSNPTELRYKIGIAELDAWLGDIKDDMKGDIKQE